MAPTTVTVPKRSARLRDKAPEDSALHVVAPSDPEDSALVAPPPKIQKVDVNAIVQSVLQDVANGISQNPITPPPVTRPRFQATVKQREFLIKLGCAAKDIDACTCKKDVDELFDIYKNIPTQLQIDYLTERGVVQIPGKKDKAQAIVARLKKELPATVDQMDFIKILWRQHNKTTPVPDDLTEERASALITELKRTRPTSDAQRTQLRAFGLAEANVRILCSRHMFTTHV